MFLIRAIPIAKAIGKDSLTYFSKEIFTPGHIASIRIRNKDIAAIIQSVEPLKSEHKADIKSLPFIVKKIEDKDEQAFFLPEFAQAVEHIAIYHATSQGAVYSALIPQTILSKRNEIVHPKFSKDHIHTVSHTEIFQADDETRIAHYKMIIREEFAKKQNVFMLVPTAHEAEVLKTVFEKGIEHHVYALHGTTTKKETIRQWNNIIESPHPVLVIATALFLSLPKIWGTIIIERESSRHYKMSSRPHLDMRTVAEYIAKEMKALCILSDVMLRIETLHRYEQGEVQEVSEPRWRSIANANIHFVDMRNYNVDKKEFTVISDELRQFIDVSKKTNRHLFIYVSRRGNASQTICRDCGTTVTCNNCSSPVVLHTTAKKADENNRFFLCHTCGVKRQAEDACSICGGWRLEMFGIGIEKVVNEIIPIAGKDYVYRIDSDTTPTRKKVLATIQSFRDKPGSILIGTDMALYYLDDQIEHVAIASLDSQFSIPDFRIKEKIFHTVLRLRTLASHELLIQTRYASLPLWQYAMKGGLIDFYREETALRKQYQYPPERTLIKISYTGSPIHVRNEMNTLKQQFEDWDLSVFPAFIEIKKGAFTMHATLRLRRNEWPNEELHAKLRALSPGYTVNVDPENLL
jgi:primosomal protein N' (replication factor Y) (superfamily II helicase)